MKCRAGGLQDTPALDRSALLLTHNPQTTTPSTHSYQSLLFNGRLLVLATSALISAFGYCLSVSPRSEPPLRYMSLLPNLDPLEALFITRRSLSLSLRRPSHDRFQGTLPSSRVHIINFRQRRLLQDRGWDPARSNPAPEPRTKLRLSKI